MKHPLVILFIAAVLEAAGDALVRMGVRSPSFRLAYWLSGAAVLFAYGYLVNAPSWDFGRLLGVYVVFFFVVAQAIGWIVFGQRPTPDIWLGGACIVLGGFIVAANG